METFESFWEQGATGLGALWVAHRLRTYKRPNTQRLRNRPSKEGKTLK